MAVINEAANRAGSNGARGFEVYLQLGGIWKWGETYGQRGGGAGRGGSKERYKAISSSIEFSECHEGQRRKVQVEIPLNNGVSECKFPRGFEVNSLAICSLPKCCG